MPEELPKFIDPRCLADQAGSVSGFISPGRLPRVVAPYRLKRPVAVSLNARIDGPWRTHLGGQIKAEVEATCQRCLGVMSVIIEHAIDVIAVHADSPSPIDADDAVDVIATVNGVFDVERFVEDEVVLACPMFPMHDNPECPPSSNNDGPHEDDRKRPFAGLATLMSATDRKGDAGNETE